MNSEMPEMGKISPRIFNDLIFPRLGARSKHVLVGPQHGVDVGIAEIVLQHEEGICVYSAEGYNKISFQYRNLKSK